jgi:predicted nucleotidyltransferase
MNKLFKIISDHIDIFNSFTEVYLFGSVIQSNKEPNDVDLLLVYEKYSDEILDAKNMIESFLKNLLVLNIDATILSEQELEQTGFIEKIAFTYKRLK